MFPALLFDFLGWVALQPHWDRLDVLEALAVPREHAPLVALELLGYGDLEHVAGLLRLDEPLEVREHVATRPVHEGYLAALELAPAASGSARDAVARFVERESRRDVEGWLRQCYGRADHALTREDPRFRAMDYPAFDNGSMGVGFGVMIDREARRWLWSHAAFFHK